MAKITGDINRTAGLSLHIQVEENLRNWISDGSYPIGTKIPSNRELCEMFGGINHQTVRRAVRKLVNEGVLESARGRGVFLKKPLSKKELRVALVLPNIEGTLQRRIIEGAKTVLSLEGVHSLILDAGFDAGHELANIKSLPDLPLNGAIIFPLPFGDIGEQIFRLKMDGFSVVVVDGCVEGIKLPSVMVDNYGGAFAAVTHLLQSGRRRIAFVSNLKMSTSKERLRGYRDAICEFGLPSPKALIYDVEVSDPLSRDPHPVQEVITRMVQDKSTMPDAIFFDHDIKALIAMDTLRKLGYRIPGDVSVVGFDDLAEAAASNPPLTTVRRPMKELGIEAAKLLLRLIRDKTSPHQEIVLPVELVVRQTG